MRIPRDEVRPIIASLRGITEALGGRVVSVSHEDAEQGAEAWEELDAICRTEDGSLELTGPSGEPLEVIRQDLGNCQRCGLCENRLNLVYGVGTSAARVFIVGEAPGEREDRRGEPFIGRSGRLLDKMISAVLKLSRSQVYITNVVKCHPPDNRDPFPEEYDRCMPFLERQILSVDPDVIMCFGKVATNVLLGLEGGISRNRGQWHEYKGIPVRTTFHPSYLLRLENQGGPEARSFWRAQKRLVHEDLLEVLDLIEGQIP